MIYLLPKLLFLIFFSLIISKKFTAKSLVILRLIDSIFNIINYKFSEESKIIYFEIIKSKIVLIGEKDVDGLEFAYFFNQLEKLLPFIQEKYNIYPQVYFNFYSINNSSKGELI